MAYVPFISDTPAFGYSAGTIANRSIVNKFGRSTSIGTTEAVIGRTNATFTGFLTAAATVRVKAGGNANDTAAGSGAQNITVVGLDSSFVEQTDTLVTAGANASAASTISFIRVFRAYVSEGGAGAYSDGVSGSNVGDIDIETSAGVLLVRIAATIGQTQLAAYTVPAGKTAYLMRISVSVPGSKTVTVRMFQRRNADDVTTPFSARRLIYSFAELSGEGIQDYPVYPSFPEKTDLWFTGQKDTAGTSAVNASFELILATN